MEKLSIIIPVFNEEDKVKEILKKVLEVKLPFKKEIIIIDDNSTDKTLEKIKEIAKMNDNFKIITHSKNKGKGSAIRTGLKYATGTIIGVQDADLEYNPKDYLKLIEPLLKKEFFVVYGSRFLEDYKHIKNRFYYGNRFLSLITSLLYLHKITDMETCYKFFRREVLEGIKLKSKRFEIEPEITSKILKRGYKIKEIPIYYNPRTEKQGKKIKPKDGILAIWTLIKYRFN